ncbi:hypothetical protein [Taibaiella soli]|uniref:Uncharacterized protein n=1 Tax=Taibaiella soli TaxID=1649169 RepID=A0A2W2AJM7_9BACT|nr:hypothetical protein [Taibaiella soli]PZF73742.1 hypothetical protein DN068_07025 [Taibaiella soli]
MNWIFYSKIFLLILESIAFVTALCTFKYHNAVFRLFFFDLLFIFLLEHAGMIVGEISPNSRFTHSISNLFLLAEIPIIYLCALKLIPSHFFQRLASVSIALFLVLWVKNAYESKFFILPTFPTMPFLFGSIFALIIFLVILIRMIGRDNIFKQPLFYFSLGMLIFYGCTIPYIGVVNYFVKKDNNILLKLVQILFVSNYIRYSLFAISYIVLARQQKARKLQETIATA